MTRVDEIVLGGRRFAVERAQRGDIAALVALLAEGPTERKLLELCANEPELVADGRHLTNSIFFAMATGTVAMVAVTTLVVC